MKRLNIIVMLLLIALIICGAAYWYFFIHSSRGSLGGQNSITSGFSPFGTSPAASNGGNNSSSLNSGGSGYISTSSSASAPIPVLRLLSATPVGGYGAADTASSTIIRWIDRGRGNVYEAREDSLSISTLSNTIVPLMYQSSWNAGLTAFIGSMLSTDGTSATSLYVQLLPQSTSTAAMTSSSSDSVTVTPYQLRGEDLPDDVIAYAVSPDKSKLFMMIDENGIGVGYVSSFNGSSPTRIFSTPLTQVTAEWPAQNTISITTKASATQEGYLYFVDPKSGTWTKILGPLPGLSTSVSHDAKYVLASVTGSSQNMLTSIYSVASSSGVDAIIRTLADTCAWGNFYKDVVYCAVPQQPPAAAYPDDWYMGSVSFGDAIWQENAVTGEIQSIGAVADQSGAPIDAYDLGLDPNDNYLFFMNKNDLSLWSLNLVAGH